MLGLIVAIDITNLPDIILEANPGLSNAVANDGLDDSRTIQTVIDWLEDQRSAGATGKVSIYIPEGVFDIAETIEVTTSDIAFEGAGAGVTILQNAETFQVGTDGLPDGEVVIDGINRDAYLFDLDENVDNLLFTRMTLTGPEIHGAIFGLLTDNLEISQIEFNDFLWSSIRLFIVSNAKIHSNLFIDAGGQANGTDGVTGGSIFATYLSNSEIYNNSIFKSETRQSNVYGIKGREFRNTRIHHNQIDVNFSIELPFENDNFVEIDHNYLNGVISIPKFAGGLVPENGFTFHIHHNYFTQSYSLEWAHNGVEVDHNVFVFSLEQDYGNLISNFDPEPAEGPTKFHNNLILNPGRGIAWHNGIYNNFSFYNNEVLVNETITPRTEGLFGFNSNTDFSTVEIRDNVIKVNGISRPLMRNPESYSAIIQNNTLVNIADIDNFENSDTGAPRGLLEPLLFNVGVNGEFLVDGFDLLPTSNALNPDNISGTVTLGGNYAEDQALIATVNDDNGLTGGPILYQ
jgi:hypothetical protein